MKKFIITFSLIVSWHVLSTNQNIRIYPIEPNQNITREMIIHHQINVINLRGFVNEWNNYPTEMIAQESLDYINLSQSHDYNLSQILRNALHFVGNVMLDLIYAQTPQRKDELIERYADQWNDAQIIIANYPDIFDN